MLLQAGLTGSVSEVFDLGRFLEGGFLRKDAYGVWACGLYLCG